ncbi:MAG TPA: hypothetical protein VJI75_01645 [Candidatus Nanoarchaeia archaeon]|nr:hypothetical protein [Candidatus Nanoarchaeia archaeon]
MAVMTDIFTQNRAIPPNPAGPTDVPTDRVLTMRAQGFSNNQILEALQRAGYGMDNISRAINQADLKEGVLEQKPPEHQKGEIMEQQMPSFQQQGIPQLHPSGIPDMGLPQSSNEGRMHEIAEAIIDEKWTDLIESVNRVLDWKDTVESRLSKLEQKVDDLRSSFDKLHEGILGKISDYDKGIVNLGTDIQALEKVFQKILPGFVDNVNELSRITARVKAAQKVKSK